MLPLNYYKELRVGKNYKNFWRDIKQIFKMIWLKIRNVSVNAWKKLKPKVE